MRRREFIAGLAGTAAWPLSGHAQQQAGKVPRIGYLGATSPSDRPPLLDAFRQGLRELRWVEGQNIVIDYRFAEGRLDRLPDLAAELVRLNVDIIVSVGTQGVTAAKNATETIPIVMIGVRDPVGTGLIASLARPGGNVTGVSGSAGLEIFAKQLELLKETVPKVRRVAILSNPANAYHQLAIKEVNVAARSLGMQLQLLEARGPTEFDGAFAAMAKERVGALVVLSDVICRLPLLAQVRHHERAERCPLLGVKRTSGGQASMSAFDPKRTLANTMIQWLLEVPVFGFVDLNQIHLASNRREGTSNPQNSTT
jgi:putative ABC transport system substrate-binding protein